MGSESDEELLSSERPATRRPVLRFVAIACILGFAGIGLYQFAPSVRKLTGMNASAYTVLDRPDAFDSDFQGPKYGTMCHSNYKTYPGMTAKECADKCDQTAGCSMFSWHDGWPCSNCCRVANNNMGCSPDNHGGCGKNGKQNCYYY